MYIIDGIAYAGEPQNYRDLPRVVSIKPLANYQLQLRFKDGAKKIYDCSPLLDKPLYQPLKNLDVFNAVYLDFGVPTWNDGQIDIAPETIYAKGVSI